MRAQKVLVDCMHVPGGAEAIAACTQSRKARQDIVVEVVAADQDARIVSAGEIMGASLVTTSSSDDIEWTLKIMRDHGVRRLPVVDSAGAMVGIVSIEDLIDAASVTLADLVQAIGTGRVAEAAYRA